MSFIVILKVHIITLVGLPNSNLTQGMRLFLTQGAFQRAKDELMFSTIKMGISELIYNTK